jgi:hypothetical protein
MLINFLPGVVIVTSARDAVAIILRLAAHPEKREDLMEWVLLSACLIVIALPIAMAVGGAAAAGVGAAVGGIAGSELGAALRAVMLMLIKEASHLVELIRFLQKFIKGDILKFLRLVKFAKYENALLLAVKKFSGKLVEVVRTLRLHLETLRYFDSVKGTIAKLAEWERRFYAVQQDALKYMPRALAELDARLAKVLVQTAPKEAHLVPAGVAADKITGPLPARQRVRDTPSNILAKVEDEAPAGGGTAAVNTSAKSNTQTNIKRLTQESKPKVAPKSASMPEEKPKVISEPLLKDKPDVVKPAEEGVNTKRQDSLNAEAIAHQEKIKTISDKIGSDIKNHPLRQAYEAEVAGLKEEAVSLAKSGISEEVIAETMWTRRREIGVKYKNVTPKPLRDYIYEVNTSRYGDPLGPSFDTLVEAAEIKRKDPYKTIIESSSRPNSDVNGLLSKFEDWLVKKEPSYLDESLKMLKD